MATDFSRKFRHDLSDVTIQHDAAATDAVRSVGANAFAHGSRLVFGEGRYQPETPWGKALLAHELAHVVQQTRQPARSPTTPSVSEEYANRAARQHGAGLRSLDAGPNASLAVAADNGFVYEDEEALSTVVSTEDEAADRILDIEAEANRSRAELGVTDAAVAAQDERAQKIRDAVQKSLAHKKKPKKRTKAPAPRLNSSPDLRNASAETIQAHRRAQAKAQILSTDPAERVALGRALENTDAAADSAQAQAYLHRIVGLRVDIEALEQDVVQSNERRRNTSSLVTGPIHLYGGAWDEIEVADFADANVHLGQAAAAVKAGRFAMADVLLAQSQSEFDALQTRFEDYGEGIQRGGRRAIIGAALAPLAPLAAVGLGAAAVPFVEGTALVAQAYPVAATTVAGVTFASSASEAITGKSTGFLNPGRLISGDVDVGRDLSGSERFVSGFAAGLDLLGIYLTPGPRATSTGGTDPVIPEEVPMAPSRPVNIEASSPAPVPGPGTLTQQELAELQAIADKYQTTLDVVGSRAAGTARNIDQPQLPTAGKGPGTRSDIDVRIDSEVDIRSRGGLSGDVANASNGAGKSMVRIGDRVSPPYIRIKPNR